MLSALVEQHKQNQGDLVKSQEQKRKKAICAADDLIQAINDSLYYGIKAADLKQRYIGQNSHIPASIFSKLHRKVMKLFQELQVFATLLKELGDVEHWASVMEKNLLEINQELENLQVTEMHFKMEN